MLTTLRQHPLLAGLAEGTFQEVCRLAIQRRLETGECLLHQGKPADRFYVLIQGQMKLTRVLMEGQEKLVEIVQPGQSFGEALMFAEQNLNPFSASALKPCLLASLDATHFRRLLEGIRNIQQAKKELGVKRPKIGITVTISALNQHRYSEVLDWLKDTGVDSVDFDYMFYTTPEHNRETEQLVPLPVHRKEEDQDLPMYLRQVNGQILYEESQKAIAKSEQYGIPIGFGPPLKTPEEMERRFLDDEYAFVEKCFYPWKTFRISPYGDVYSCSIDVAFGNVREQSVIDIWNNEAYQTFRRALKKRRLFPKCAKCCALNNEFWKYLPTLG